MSIRYLFFDIGYTLVDEDAVWEARCREQADMPEARTLGLSAGDIYREIEEASRQYLPQYRAVVKKYGFTLAAPFRGELETLYPEAPAVLAALSEKYRLGVIANQAKGLKERLSIGFMGNGTNATLIINSREWGVLSYFSAVASSWEAGFLKPDPALFRYALSLAGCAPEEAVMIGDRLDNDIFPAKALGMKTVWIRQGFGALQTPKGPEYTPDYTVDSLTELPGIFL